VKAGIRSISSAFKEHPPIGRDAMSNEEMNKKMKILINVVERHISGNGGSANPS
jgi:hypothetical protein